jgi:hypothetical protein
LVINTKPLREELQSILLRHLALPDRLTIEATSDQIRITSNNVLKFVLVCVVTVVDGFVHLPFQYHFCPVRSFVMLL